MPEHSPPLAPPDEQETRAVNRTLRLSIAEGSLTQTFLNWTTGSVLIGYMLHFGASPTEIGLVSSVPLLAQASSPFAAWLAGFAARLKGLTVIAALLGRLCWVLAAFLPQLGLADELRVPFLVMLVSVSSFFQASVGTLWTGWMGSVVPEDRRGRYFGLRAGVVGVVGTLANFAAGWVLDRLNAPLSFQLVIAAAVVLALVGVSLYLYHYEPPAKTERHSLGEILNIPWRDPNFRKFLLFGSYWQASVLVAAPFVIPYFLSHLQMTFTQIALWGAVAASTALVTNPLWGRVADRYGNKAVLAIGSFLAGSLLPLTWLIAAPERLWPIWVGGVMDALAWGAVGPALFNLLLVSAPKSDRLPYVAMFSLVTGVAGFVGGLASGPLFSLVEPLEFTLGSYRWTAYHYLIVASALLRTQGWRFVRPLQETNAWRTRDVLKQARYGWRGVGFPWR